MLAEPLAKKFHPKKVSSCVPQTSIFCCTDFGSALVLDVQQKLKPFLHSTKEQMALLSLEFIALSCSSEVLFVKFPWFVAFFVGLFFGSIHFHAGPCCRPRKYRLAVDLITCTQTSFYSNSNHLFHETNKHNPFSGHRAHLYRFEIVLFQAIQSSSNPLSFNTLCNGFPKHFCSAVPLKKRFFYAAPLMDSLDINDACKCLITNLKRHFCQWRNHANAHNPWK